ncbi:MAG: hypothetical protein N3F09_01285 [Bacteroidia bacterium]|nr:hypothetical protein [Bacteroidia bacterium]
MNKNIAFACTAIILTIISCKKDRLNFDKFSTSNINPEYGAPLVNSELTIREILQKADKDNNIVVDNTGFCTLVYRGLLFTSNAKDFIKIPNQTISPSIFDINSTTGLAAFNGAANGTSFGPYTQNFTHTVLPTPPLIDSVFCANGVQLNVNINNLIPANITLTLSSSSIIDLTTNQTFSKVITASTGTNVTYNLANHLLKLNDGTNRSRLHLSYRVSFQKTGNATTGNENVSISLSLNNINFLKFIGFLGNNFTHPQFAPYKDTVPISLFKSSDPTFTNTIFSMVDPKFQIRFYNEIGANAELDLTKLDAYTPGPGNTNLNPNTLSGSPVIQNVLVNKAHDFNAPVTTSLAINKNNEPNVVPFINSRPKNVIYEVNGVLNPNSTSSYIRNFVTDTSKIRVDLDVIIPLWGNMKNLIFMDTSKVDLSDLNPQYIRKLTLRTYFENTFPFTMGTEIVFTDSLNNLLYTFLPPGTVVIPGAVVNNNGIASQPTVFKKDYELPHSAIAIIKSAKKIRIRAFAETTNYPQDIKVYDFQKLKVKIGMAIQPVVKNMN